MKVKLSTKMFLGIAGILLVLCLLLFTVLQHFLPRQYASAQNDRFTQGLLSLAEQLQQVPAQEWQALTLSFSTEYQCLIDIYDDANQRVVSVGSTVMVATDDDLETPPGEEMISTTIPFSYNGVDYNIMGMAPAETGDQVSALFPQLFPYFLVFIIIISLLVALLYARIFTKPIVIINEASKRMASLDLNWSCQIKRNDELGELAENMNVMSNNLSTALEKLQRINDQLKMDIEKERFREKQRRDFFTAVSHELKTPVTVLKGELDGMIQNIGVFKNRDKYLRESYETVEDIEELIKEIATLGKIEDITPHKQAFNISALAGEVIAMYDDIAAEKELCISSDLGPEVECFADKAHIKTVLSNVIGNAIFHSANGAFVQIRICPAEKVGHFTVENEAEPIGMEDMARIFEPFYRVDKSRSRHTGGSGLGLYIVKTILELHSFSYSFCNTDNGIKFEFTF